MASEKERERKLAVLLHADVVGSTTLVQRDETLAHERITKVFTVFSNCLHRYGGTVHEIRGDALVAEFERASDAVAGALAAQAASADYSAQFSDDIQPRMRVGVALGEVVIADSTVTGPGIVLAQRLEQLAEPGGVCVQGSVYEAVPQRLPYEFTNLGEHSLKGFKEPVRAFSAALVSGSMLPAPESKGTGRPSSSRLPIRAIAAVLIVAMAIGAWWWLTRLEVEPTNEAATAVTLLPDKPSIAVLPFVNMSDDPRQSYFSDGLTGDIITDLARVSGLLVIARSSTFVYKGQAVDVTELGRKLGVRYVVEGSVRRSGTHLRISAQLVDASSGLQIWANRYDREMTDVFTLQDEVTRTIVGALSVQLSDEEERAISTIPSANADAYDLLLQGNESLSQFSREGFARARALYQEALDYSPKYARAHANIAFTYAQEAQYGLTNNLEETIKLGLVAVERARQLDERLPQMHLALGSLLGAQLRWQAAGKAARRSLELEPSYADGYALLSFALTFVGDLDGAHSAIERAKRLNPHYSFAYRWVEGRIHFLGQRYELAATLLEATLERNPDFEQPRVELAATYARLGRNDDASWEVEHVLFSNPDFRIAKSVGVRGFVDESLKTLYIDALRQAGFPD